MSSPPRSIKPAAGVLSDLAFRPRAAASVVPWRANGPGTTVVSAAGAPGRLALRALLLRLARGSSGRARRRPRCRAARGRMAATAG
jgi:hypothetical protein